MPTVDLDIPTPAWALPLLEPARYKGAKGGRASGKSHFFAERAVEEMVCDPDLRFVCIREVQKSLRFSAKSLIESKIRTLGVEHLFHILTTEIRRVGGTGIMIFEGMQDHTADSIKSIEGFGRAWVEEAQRMSKRSLDLLLPSIRSEGSEIWFSWNPEQPDDPVDELFATLAGDPKANYALVHSNYLDNPFCPPESLEEADRDKRTDPDKHAHVWLGGYNVKSDAQVLSGKWRIDEFDPLPHWNGPYYGADWGFSQDPTTLVRCWVGDNRLWVEYETGGVRVGLDETPRLFSKVPGFDTHVIRADSARPETINYLQSTYRLKVEPAPKWTGSVEDGVEYLRRFEEIVIHERCTKTAEEARLWSYKTDRLTGDPLPKLADGHEHYWDAVRYALAPLIQAGRRTHYTGPVRWN